LPQTFREIQISCDKQLNTSYHTSSWIPATIQAADTLFFFANSRAIKVYFCALIMSFSWCYRFDRFIVRSSYRQSLATSRVPRTFCWVSQRCMSQFISELWIISNWKGVVSMS